jgi:lipid II:glycine glycyltransferase (peptidoglycan interpeptide bridge formation enzyme)
MIAEKQERATQRQLLQKAKREEKEAEKAQKALKKEKKRRQKEQDKQAKTALSLRRKKEQEIHKQLAVAAQLTTLSDVKTQRLSAGPSTTCKTRRISTKKIVKPPKGS